MIRSFADKDTEQLFRDEHVQRFQPFERVARKRLMLLHAATILADLKGPGLALEELTKDRKGQRSIRINQAWRLCFTWSKGDASDVEIVNYH